MADYEDINELGDDDRQADILNQPSIDDEYDDEYDDDLDDELDDEVDEVGEEVAHTDFTEKILVVAPDERRTDNFLSDFEMTEITSIRATQIAINNNCQVDITGMTNPIEMAWKELMARRCPLKVRRTIGEYFDGDTHVVVVEDWDVNLMGFSRTVET